MFEFFDMISNLIGTVVNFIVTMFENLLFVLLQIIRGFAAIGLALSFVPDVIKLIVTAIVSYVFIINILNRGA